MDYQKLAQLSLQIPDFDMEELQRARRFYDESKHIKVYPGLTFCGVTVQSDEDRDGFADGSTQHENGDITVDSYWLINGRQSHRRTTASYRYWVHGHSGGVADAVMSSLDSEELVRDEASADEGSSVDADLLIDIFNSVCALSPHVRFEVCVPSTIYKLLEDSPSDANYTEVEAEAAGEPGLQALRCFVESKQKQCRRKTRRASHDQCRDKFWLSIMESHASSSDAVCAMYESLKMTEDSE